jgi:hypothetical protein
VVREMGNGKWRPATDKKYPATAVCNSSFERLQKQNGTGAGFLTSSKGMSSILATMLLWLLTTVQGLGF